MTPANYLKSLLPTFTKDKVTQDLQISREEFENHVVEQYETFEKNFKDYDFACPELTIFKTMFMNSTGIKFSGNWVCAMYKRALKHIPEKIDFAETVLEHRESNDIITSSIRALDLNAVQMAEVLSFMVRYARRLLNFLVQTEINYLNEFDLKKNLVVGEIQWITDNFAAFLTGVRFLLVPKADTKQMLDTVPDVLINGNNVGEVKAVAGDTIDPFNFGLIPVKLNPIYHVGMRIAEYQAARYHEAQAEKQSLSVKIMLLKKRAEGKNDAKMEAVIEKYEAIRAKKTYELSKMEEKYGLE